MKKINYIALSGITLLLATLVFTSCTDKNDWETYSSYDRLFSVTKMSISPDATEAELTWTRTPLTEYYMIELSKDSLYDEVEMGESATSVVYGEDKSIIKSPYMLANLDGNTKYYLRIRSMSQTKESSKWSYPEGYFFKTKAEQIITNITTGSTNVTIEWPANSNVTHLTIEKKGVETNRRNITSEEIAAGKATMEGLTSETEYTIYLMNGSLLRGSKTFTTLMDLGGAIAINEGDDIATILTGAEEGDIFAVLPGTYEVNAKIALTKTITVRGAIPGKAIIKGMSFAPAAGTGIELRDLVLDGTTPDDIKIGQLINYTEEYKTADTPALTIIGCDIRNYADGFINQRVIIAVNSINITGNFFNKIGGRFIDIQKGYVKTINLINNTIANSISGDAIRIDDSAGFTNVSCVINIHNNTFYKVCNGAANNRLLYTRLAGHSISLSKNLITYSQGYYSDQSKTIVAEMLNNYYFDAPNYHTGTKTVIDTEGTELNPEFTDPENLDFTVRSNTVITAGIGDPRWLQ